jgi:predicted MFS family arabinose efflux permease
MAAMARRFLIDLTPLRANRDFRRLFVGQAVSMVGSQLTVVAIAYQVYSLTRSSLQVGAVSLAQLVPFVAGTLAGGAIGDALDRRRVLVVTSLLLALASGGMALNALAGPHASILAIYLVTATAAGLSGVVATTTTAAVPSLVAADQLTPAYATMQVIDQVGMVVGPALSGGLIAALGLPWLYGIDALTFLWTGAFLWRMAEVHSPGPVRRPGVRSVLEGLGYLRGRQELQGAYVIDLCATVFGLPRALFPALARTVFHGGPTVLGILYAAPAAGALAGSLTSGWLTSVRRQGRAVLVAVAAWGAIIVAFGFARAFWVALVLLILAGWADVISAVLRSTIVQTAVSEPFRSRISGVQMAVVEGGPRLGDLESGAVANAVSTQFSIVSGGVVCAIGALAVALLLPGFRRYSQHPDRP